MSRMLAPGGNQSEHDLVMTPQWLADQIVEVLPIEPGQRVLDPACGEGAFLKSLYEKEIAIDWCEIARGKNFFDWKEPVDWIITNPPWSQIRAFTLRAMALAPNVVWLCTLTHFVTRARMNDLREAGFGLRRFWLCEQPPPPWPSNGFQLGAIWICKGWTGGLEFDRMLLAETILNAKGLDL